MALWKARSLSPEEKVRIVEQESETQMLENKESGSFVGIEDINMSDVYSSALDINVRGRYLSCALFILCCYVVIWGLLTFLSCLLQTNSFMELFNGGEIEQRVMEKTGCVDYSCTPWESGDTGFYQRQICYKFSKRISSSGEVKSTQQKSSLSDKNGWLVEEIITLNGVPYSDHFNVSTNTCHVLLVFM